VSNLNTKVLLNRTEAADFLGRSRRTLYKWEKEGIGPPVIHDLNGMPYYTRKTLEAPESWRMAPIASESSRDY